MNQLIHYHKVNLLRIGNLRLMPGMNQIPEEIWKEAKSHPLIQHRLNSGEITVLAQAKSGVQEKTLKNDLEKKVSETGENSNSLDSYSTNQAKDIVQNTFDLNLLRRWQTEETRKAVYKVVEAQIEKIESYEEKDAEVETE